MTMKNTYYVWGSWQAPDYAVKIDAATMKLAAELWMEDHMRAMPGCHWITQDVAVRSQDAPNDIYVFRVKYRVKITADAEEIAGPSGPIEVGVFPSAEQLDQLRIPFLENR